MNAMDIADRGETGTGGSGDSAGRPPLLGRKSMLMGLLTSGFVIAGATRPSAAAAETVKPTAPATAKPLADTQAPSAPLWTPSTDYALGQQVISPHNDVVSANVGHTSSADYATDTANWTLSSTFSGKATETTVTSGRLSQASLAGAYAQVINIVGPGIDATGATHCSAAIQSMFSRATSGQIINLPPGTYQASGLSLPSGVILNGHGGDLQGPPLVVLTFSDDRRQLDRWGA